MPRRNRRATPRSREAKNYDVTSGVRRETKRGRSWNVRNIDSTRAQKIYVCPGCPGDIMVGQAHLVVWSGDHFFGDDFSVSDRRHWHSHCWRIH